MIHRRSIDDFCNVLAQQKPDWQRIKDKFESTSLLKKHKEFAIHQYAQFFSEIALDLYLEKISTENPSLPLKLFPQYTLANPLSNSNHKLYHNSLGRIYVDSTKHKIWEYDQLVLIEKIPVVLEIKLRKWNTGKERKRKQSNDTYRIEKNDSIKNNLRPEIYHQKLRPLQHIFNRDIGYVMIISNDQYTKACSLPEDVVVSQFFRNHGKLVPFYTDRLTFREHVREKVKEFGYPLKEEPGQLPQQPEMYIP